MHVTMTYTTQIYDTIHPLHMSQSAKENTLRMSQTQNFSQTDRHTHGFTTLLKKLDTIVIRVVCW